jgi:uncharacterized protein YndB with AHSA1/START domain
LSKTQLRLERLIAAPPERVFAFWINPEQIVRWWGPEGYEIPSSNFDVRPGGKWSTMVQTPDGQRRTVSGIYRAIEPPRRLVFTWGWLGDDGERGHETEVTVTFEAAPGGTRLVLRQQSFEGTEILERHGQSWASSFDRLARAAG